MKLSQKTVVLLAVASILIAVGAGVVLALTGTVPTEGPASIQAQSGMTGTLETNGFEDVYWESNFPTTSSVEFVTTNGNVTFISSGTANATIHTSNITGTWTNVTDVDADPNTITIDPEDKNSAVVGKAITAFSYRGTQSIDDGTVDFVYSASANGRVTVQGVAGDTRIAAVDADNGKILDESTSTSGGVLTLDTLDSGSHDVTLQTFTPAAPTLSNASPTGDLTSQPSQISIDVNDSEFATGDSVTVTIDLDGSQIHSQTISSNGTVSTSMPSSGQTGGSHSWSVEATDSFGETTTDSYSYNVPSTLTIFNESAPASKVDNVEVTVQFFKDEQVVERSTNNGEIDLSGLPVSREMIVVASADGYSTRRTYIDSIYEQQEVYLLNDSIQTASVVFELEDRTGSFPAAETVLRIQRPLTKDFNGDGTQTTEYRTVAGDYFGASGAFPSELVEDTRYRLTVENAEGDIRSLGTYTPTGDAVEQLPIGQVQFGATESGTATMQGSLIDHNNSRYVRVTYYDGDAQTNELEYTILNASDRSDVLQPNVTVSGPLRSYSETVSVPSSAPDDVGYVIVWSAHRGTGEDVSGEVFVGDTPAFLRNLGLDPTVAAYIAFVALAALVGFVVIYDDKMAALTAVIGASVLAMGGIVSINPIALGVAGTIALIYTIARIR